MNDLALRCDVSVDEMIDSFGDEGNKRSLSRRTQSRLRHQPRHDLSLLGSVNKDKCSAIQSTCFVE